MNYIVNRMQKAEQNQTKKAIDHTLINKQNMQAYNSYIYIYIIYVYMYVYIYMYIYIYNMYIHINICIPCQALNILN